MHDVIDPPPNRQIEIARLSHVSALRSGALRVRKHEISTAYSRFRLASSSPLIRQGEGYCNVKMWVDSTTIEAVSTNQKRS